ncbi:MAG TPA: amino acid racemase [Alphaproteobacteria bacterium]
MNKKIVGVIGGMGPQASVTLYNHVIQTAIATYGAVHNNDFPHVLISNLPVPDAISSRDDEQKLITMLVDEARRLADAGCVMIVMACNTAHIFEEHLHGAALGLFVSLIDLVKAKVQTENIQKIAVMGSPMTIESGLYRHGLERDGVIVLQPDKDLLPSYERLIRYHIAGQTSAQDRQFLQEQCTLFHRQGVEKIILGCTELSSLVSQESLNGSFIDPLLILADKICAVSLDVKNRDRRNVSLARSPAEYLPATV